MKIFIKNRNNLSICVEVHETPNSRGLVFVSHGLGGWKEQPQIINSAQAFIDNNFTVVCFDATNSFGESEGDYLDATATNYYHDLEDVIEWSKTQSWYKEPFCLIGHSLGALSSALYSEKFPEKAEGLVPISTVVSGKLTLESGEYKNNNVLEEWEKTGIRETPSLSRPGLTKKLKWSHIEDRLKYDLMPKVNKLTMPTLMIVGELDTGTPLEHQKILFDKLPGEKEIHVIPGAPHTFKDPEHLSEVKSVIDRWIKKHF
ncbi:MAG: alpha/beta hydrolase [Bacteroidota bacterium]